MSQSPLGPQQYILFTKRIAERPEAQCSLGGTSCEELLGLGGMSRVRCVMRNLGLCAHRAWLLKISPALQSQRPKGAWVVLPTLTLEWQGQPAESSRLESPSLGFPSGMLGEFCQTGNAKVMPETLIAGVLGWLSLVSIPEWHGSL